MSRLPETPTPLKVRVNGHSQPARLTWPSGRHERVVEVVHRWRVDDDWWRVPINRTYYKVLTPTRLLEVYVDLNTGDWFLERVVD